MNGKPIVVLSNNDGCVIARSQEAKDLTIKMGVPYWEIKNLIKTHDVKVFSSNYQLYGDMSERVMNIIKDYCGNVEIYSIDESFLPFEWCGTLHQVTQSVMAQNALTESMTEGV